MPKTAAKQPAPQAAAPAKAAAPKNPPAAKKKEAPTPQYTQEKPKVSLWTRLSVRLSEKERVLFAKYLSVLLESGLALPQAIEVLEEQATGATKTILKSALADLQNGRTLADGLARFPHVFSNIFINLIGAGETSGTLNANLLYLAEQSQKQYELKQSVRGAMMYPMLVLIGGTTVGILIVVFIFPNIIALFETMKVELPITTRILLFVANFFESYPIQVMIGSIAFVVTLFVSWSIPFTKRIWDHILLRIPVVGSLLRNGVLANVFRLLGTLLESGTPLRVALQITNSTISNAAFKNLFTSLEKEVTQGDELIDELKQHKNLVPPLAQRLIHVGNETGTLEKMLLYLGDFYAKEVDESSKRIATLMEPMLIILMGGMIAFLAMSVISPIYSVITNV